jgi:hypothetical protein
MRNRKLEIGNLLFGRAPPKRFLQTNNDDANSNSFHVHKLFQVGSGYLSKSSHAICILGLCPLFFQRGPGFPFYPSRGNFPDHRVVS